MPQGRYGRHKGYSVHRMLRVTVVLQWRHSVHSISTVSVSGVRQPQRRNNSVKHKKSTTAKQQCKQH
jgi:hypothetical protein